MKVVKGTRVVSPFEIDVEKEVTATDKGGGVALGFRMTVVICTRVVLPFKIDSE